MVLGFTHYHLELPVGHEGSVKIRKLIISLKLLEITNIRNPGIFILRGENKKIKALVCPLKGQLIATCVFFAHPRMRTFWRSCSGYRLGARTHRHFQRSPSRVSFTEFDLFARLCSIVCFAFPIHPPTHIRVGSMEREDDETGRTNSNVAGAPESCLTVALPEVRLGASKSRNACFCCWRNVPSF